MSREVEESNRASATLPQRRRRATGWTNIAAYSGALLVVVGGLVPLAVRAEHTVSSSLADDQVVSGAVQWEAIVPGGTTSVLFTIDGGSAWVDDGAPFVYGGDAGTWDTTRYSDGVHRLIVRAWDADHIATRILSVRVANRSAGCSHGSNARCEPDTPPQPSNAPGSDEPFVRHSFRLPNPTSMAWGPDGRLYVTEMFGLIHAVRLNDGMQVVEDTLVSTLEGRLTLGIEIDPGSTSENVILWVSHSHPSLDQGLPNAGVVSRLAGPEFKRRDIVTGLPRALTNHATNSIHFGPDGLLYIAQGGTTAAGAPNLGASDFGDRPEQPLSAAILVADVRATDFRGTCGSDPGDSAIPETCDVRPFATGFRNTYDFVWASNGQMYATSNGLGVAGTFPPRPTPACTGLGDQSPWTQGGHDPGAQPDALHRVERGSYHGHPNPYRDECVFGDGRYQDVPSLATYEAPILVLGEHRSPNGFIEYRGDALGGELRGELLVANYATGDDVTRIRLSSDGTVVIGTSSLVGGFADPLPLAQAPDGTIFVGEFGGGRVTALVPLAP